MPPLNGYDNFKRLYQTKGCMVRYLAFLKFLYRLKDIVLMHYSSPYFQAISGNSRLMQSLMSFLFLLSLSGSKA
jgi:hypothetical protein